MTKHTPGKLEVAGKPIDNGFTNRKEPRYIRAIDEEGTSVPIAIAQNPQDANRLALCWNTHDQLLEALQAALIMIKTMQPDWNKNQESAISFSMRNFQRAIDGATQNPHRTTKE